MFPVLIVLELEFVLVVVVNSVLLVPGADVAALAVALGVAVSDFRALALSVVSMFSLALFMCINGKPQPQLGHLRSICCSQR